MRVQNGRKLIGIFLGGMAANRLFFILSTTVVQVYFTWSLGYALKKQRITNMGIAKNT